MVWNPVVVVVGSEFDSEPMLQRELEYSLLEMEPTLPAASILSFEPPRARAWSSCTFSIRTGLDCDRSSPYSPCLSFSGPPGGSFPRGEIGVMEGGGVSCRGDMRYRRLRELHRNGGLRNRMAKEEQKRGRLPRNRYGSSGPQQGGKSWRDTGSGPIRKPAPLR